jgi:hypothetical protein
MTLNERRYDYNIKIPSCKRRGTAKLPTQGTGGAPNPPPLALKKEEKALLIV